MGTWKRCVGRNSSDWNSREMRYEHSVLSTRNCGWAAMIPTCNPRVCTCTVLPGTHGKSAQRINWEGQRKESANKAGVYVERFTALG